MGQIVPKVADLPRAPFAILAAGYGVLAIGFVIGGTLRAKRTAEESGSHLGSETWIIASMVYMALLIGATVLAVLLYS